MAGDDDVNIRLTAENRVNAPLAEAADSVNRLGDESSRAGKKLDALILKEAALGKITRDTNGKIKDSTGHTYKLGDVSEGTRKQIAELTTAMNAHARAQDNLHSELKESTSLFDKMHEKIEKTKFEAENLTKIFEIFRHPAIAEGVSLIATAIDTMSAAGIAAVHGLAPMGSLIAAYPSTMAAGAQAMGVFKLATDGLAGAISAMTTPGEDPAALAKALYAMSPAAASFAEQVAKLETGPLRTLKFAVQGALFSNLGNSLQAVTPLFGLLTPYLTQTATLMASVVRQVAAFVASPFFQGQITSLMGNNVKVLSNMAQSAFNLARALLDVIVDFEPVERAMSASTKAGTAWLSLWVGDHAQEITNYFEHAYKLFQGVVQIIKELGTGIYYIAKDSTALGNEMGNSFSGMFKSFQSWTESFKGQNDIKNFFAQAEPVLQATGQLIKGIVTAFFDIPESNNLVNMLNTMRTVLLPEIEEFIKNAQGNLGPTIIKLVSALLKFEDALPTGPQLKVLEGVVAMIDTLATGIEKLPGPMRTFLAVLVSSMLAFKAFSLAGSIALKPAKEITEQISNFRSGLSDERETKGFWGGFTSSIRSAGKTTTGSIRDMRAGFSDIDSAMIDSGSRSAKFGGTMKSAMNGVIKPFKSAATATKEFTTELIANTRAGAAQGLEKLKSGITATSDAIKGAAIATRDWTKATWENLTARVKSIATSIKDIAVKIWDRAVTIATAIAEKAQAAAQWLVNAATSAFDVLADANPFGLIIIAVGLLVTGFILLYRHSSRFRDMIHEIGAAFVWFGKESLGVLRVMVEPLVSYLNLWIKGLNLIIGLYDKIPFSHKISKIPTIGGGIGALGSYYAGGQVPSGTRALVGEIGPEAFVNTAGVIKMIGTQGPEIMDFSSRGFIVPNYALDQAASSGVDIAAMAHAMSGGTVGPASIHAPTSGTTIIHEGSITVPVYAAQGQNSHEIAQEVVRIVERRRQNARERTSVWARADRGL